MPEKTTTTDTTVHTETQEYVDKTHSEKVSDGMKEYWKNKKLAEKDAEIEKLQRQLDKAKEKIKKLKS